MATVRLFSDPHLGLQRSSHTTQDSRRRLADALYQKALEVTDTNDPVICLGDLFDKFSNPEVVIAQGYVIARRCEYVLPGNHDSSNRTNVVSSLQLIQNTSAVSSFCDHKLFTTIPHQLSQEAFDDKLDRLYVEEECEKQVLLLHCNYDSNFADAPTALNLTRERAERLLEIFDFILIGHEHVARSDFGGRLQLLGNIHPTSFADISDKYYWELDTETMTLHRVLCWEKERHYFCTDDPASLEELDELQFLDIQGTVEASQMPALAKTLAMIWKRGPELFMLRNGMKITGSEEVVKPLEGVERVDLVSMIRSELNGSLLDLFNRYVEGAEHDSLG